MLHAKTETADVSFSQTWDLSSGFVPLESNIQMCFRFGLSTIPVTLAAGREPGLSLSRLLIKMNTPQFSLFSSSHSICAWRCRFENYSLARLGVGESLPDWPEGHDITFMGIHFLLSITFSFHKRKTCCKNRIQNLFETLVLCVYA